MSITYYMLLAFPNIFQKCGRKNISLIYIFLTRIQYCALYLQKFDLRISDSMLFIPGFTPSFLPSLKNLHCQYQYIPPFCKMKRRLHPKILREAKNVIQSYWETAPREDLIFHTQTPPRTALKQVTDVTVQTLNCKVKRRRRIQVCTFRL